MFFLLSDTEEHNIQYSTTEYPVYSSPKVPSGTKLLIISVKYSVFTVIL